MIRAYPLEWPQGFPRTPAHQRTWGPFKVPAAQAWKELREEIERSGGRNPIVSTMRRVRRDGGWFHADQHVDDPGVCVYFERKGQRIGVPCDSYDQIWKNARAIGLSIKDMRGPEMRGCAVLTDRAFSGFAALPPPDPNAIVTPAAKPWHAVLGVAPDAPPAVIKGGRGRSWCGRRARTNAWR